MERLLDLSEGKNMVEKLCLKMKTERKQRRESCSSQVLEVEALMIRYEQKEKGRER